MFWWESGKLGDDFVVRNIGGVVWKFYVVLGDEVLQQIVYMVYYFWIVVQFVRVVLFNGLDVYFFDVFCDNFGEGMMQVGGQYFYWLIWGEFEVGYVFVGWIKWYLQVW